MLALAAAVGVAGAQDPGPATVQPDTVGGENRPDTDFTPVAKRGLPLFQQLGGARFPDGAEEEADPRALMTTDSPTTFDDNLYAVAFRNGVEGLVGGATCEVSTPGAETGCRPLVLHYTDTPDFGPRWERVALPGATRAGYVGAIAWTPHGEALVVGGTGRYVDREEPWQADGQGPGEAFGVRHDPAGHARAWLYDGEDWQELGDLPPDMRGLSAVDVYHGQGLDLGFAGGLGQLWRWRNGKFDPNPIDTASPSSEMVGARYFGFRVRQIRFAAGQRIQAFAATAGCCAELALENTSRLLSFDGEAIPPRWYARVFPGDVANQGQPDLAPTGESVGAPQPDRLDEPRRANGRAWAPDSMFALAVRAVADSYSVAAVLAAGGRRAGDERASHLAGPGCIGPSGRGRATSSIASTGESDRTEPTADVLQVLRTNVSTARLLGGDGDASPVGSSTFRYGSTLGLDDPVPKTTADPNYVDRPTNLGHLGALSITLYGLPCASMPAGDGLPDWSVGQLGSTARSGLGEQAVAFASALSPALIPDVVEPHETVKTLTTAKVKQPDGAKLNAYLESRLFLLPSYTLRALDMVGDSGVGWAVGDRGAILRIAERRQTDATLEPAAGTVGARVPVQFEGREAYDAVARTAAVGDAGPVPALAEQPLERLAGVEVLQAGSPNPTLPLDEPPEDVAQIVMSRDGEEGWAVGAGTLVADVFKPQLTLYHYDGAQWSRCDPLGVHGQYPADPACRDLAPLTKWFKADGSAQTTNLRLAVRVPLERDADPANDGEFEVAAVGTKFAASPNDPAVPTLARYRNGRWELESTVGAAASDILEFAGIAFTGPDDGWILGNLGSGYALLHYDGERWSDCRTSPCGNLGDVIPQGLATTDNKVVLRGLAQADGRVFAYGSRNNYPLIAFTDGDGRWQADPDDGGLDLGAGKATGVTGQGLTVDGGSIDRLAAVRRPDGGWEGWATGRYDGVGAVGLATVFRGVVRQLSSAVVDGRRVSRWAPYQADDAVTDKYAYGRDLPLTMAIIGSGEAGPRALLGGPTVASGNAAPDYGQLLGFGIAAPGWAVVPQPARQDSSSDSMDVAVEALAPDGNGGAWQAVRLNTGVQIAGSKVAFFHVTDRRRRPVFADVAHPLHDPGLRVTGLAGAANGSVWAATNSGRIARHDPRTGWETLSVAGWDPGKLVTQPSPMHAVATAPDGVGIAVGKAGRIADLTLSSAVLDPAAGITCTLVVVEPCTTGRDLRAAAVAPDHSALAGGDGLALLWRPADGGFRAIARPEAAATTTITGIVMPAPDRAWLTTANGLVFRGTMAAPGEWSWTVENRGPNGDQLGLDANGNASPLRAIGVDAAGHGYAVGDRGLLLQRTGDGEHPWRRLRTSFLDDLTAVALPVGGGRGGLVGGRNGLVLTVEGQHVALARPAEFLGGSDELNHTAGSAGPVRGLALLPGTEPGQVDAWVSLEDIGDGNRLLHYTNDPERELETVVKPLPDAPAPRPGEVTLAAFGKADCADCFPVGFRGSTLQGEVLARRIVAAVEERSRRQPNGMLAVYTGDAVDARGAPGGALTDEPVNGFAWKLNQTHNVPFPRYLRRWKELVADPLEAAGVPLLATVGREDLSGPCDRGCELESGDWRQAMAGRRTPWGARSTDEDAPLLIEDADGARDTVRRPDPSVAPTVQGLRRTVVPLGGARTHYAIDVSRPGDEEPAARVVFVDTSHGGLQLSDHDQQPTEIKGGQAAFLERMLCFAPGTTVTGAPCTRAARLPAVVVTSLPTYSYGPGGTTDTMADAATVETLLRQFGVTAVVTGRLGWNGLYWITQPGLHEPCPGGAYREQPPAAEIPACNGEAAAAATGLSRALRTLEAPALPVQDTGAAGGPIPVAIAASGSVPFGPDGSASGSASDGFWHGYTVVRIPAPGDRTGPIFEQRPVFDWIGIEGSRHVLRPGQTIRVRGIGREPVGSAPDNVGDLMRTRFDEIDSPAITHRYDLIEADPQRPWLPRVQEGNGNPHGYVPLSASVATIDPQTGVVRATRTDHGRVYALAVLSVDQKAASWPLVIEPRRSYVPTRVRVAAAAPAPPVRVLGFSAQSLSAPPGAPPATAPPPVSASLELPVPPAPPLLPPAVGPPTTPSVPPAPPAPPGGQQGLPLSLSISPVGVAVPPPPGVTAQPTPPVQPSPPSGARREAKQRQAATAKSEEGGGDKADVQSLGGDMADRPSSTQGAAMTRRDRIRPAADGFTPLTRASAQPSAWTTGLQWGGGIGLLALALALGFTTARPTPRRRPPTVPAPAHASRGRRRL